MRKARALILLLAAVGFSQPVYGHSSGRALLDRDAVAGVRTSDRVVALTFDDGPDPRWTPHVLDILAREGVPATFFVLGPFVEQHPDLVRAEVAAGMDVGCHGWDHVVMVGMAPEAVVDVYQRCARAVNAVVGHAPAIVRPPYGLLAPAQFDELRDAGFTPVDWNVNGLPTGWHPSARLKVVADEMRPGAIVLLHDGRRDRRPVVEFLPTLIAMLKEKGYRFVTVSELLASGHAIPENTELIRKRYCAKFGMALDCEMPGL